MTIGQLNSLDRIMGNQTKRWRFIDLQQSAAISLRLFASRIPNRLHLEPCMRFVTLRTTFLRIPI